MGPDQHGGTGSGRGRFETCPYSDVVQRAGVTGWEFIFYIDLQDGTVWVRISTVARAASGAGLKPAPTAMWCNGRVSLGGFLHRFAGWDGLGPDQHGGTGSGRGRFETCPYRGVSVWAGLPPCAAFLRGRPSFVGGLPSWEAFLRGRTRRRARDTRGFGGRIGVQRPACARIGRIMEYTGMEALLCRTETTIGWP